MNTTYSLVHEMEPCTRSKIASKQTGKVRKLQIVLGLLSLITIGLIVATSLLAIQVKQKNDELKEVSNICNSTECFSAAWTMIDSMNLSASPCDDFYQFACGGWLKNNPLWGSTSSWDRFDELRDNLRYSIYGILKRKVNESDPIPLNIAKQFYSSCVAQNTTSHEELSELLKQLLEETQLNPNELGGKLGELRRVVAGNFIIAAFVDLDEENATRHTLYVDQPSLGLNRIYLVQSPEHAHKTAYVELIEEIWELIYPDVENRNEIAMQLVEFETKLAEISAKPEDRRDRTKLHNPMTVRELSELTQNATMINWEKYIEETFQGVEKFGNIQSLRVVVRGIPYFTELGHVLTNVTEESPDIIWNYLRWRIIWGYANDVNNKFRDIVFNYRNKTEGISEPPERWVVCSDLANSYFGMAISYRYVQDAFMSDFQQQMAEMIANLQQAFYEILSEVDWFGDPQTKAKAKQKAEQMNTFIGYPEWLLNTSNNHSALREFYEGMPETMSEDHFQNIIAVFNWKNTYYLKHLNRPKNPKKWVTDPTVVNAYYSRNYNAITFAAGILSQPFYYPGKPIQALNYGAIGQVIGHEITHGFDDTGRQSDGHGNLVDWWDEETVTQYTEKTQCFINQYSNYTAEEADNMTLNGINTLGENIADNGGVRQAFRAYQSFVRKNGVEPRLPGLLHSPEQLFFIAYSQCYCGVYSKPGMENQIKTGFHSPNRFRVRGVLHNSVEFAETWNCPRPRDLKTCRIW